MNMKKLRNQVRNVVTGRMFETLAFCVMYFMVIGMLSMFICSMGTCFFVGEYDKLGMLFGITIATMIILNSFLVVGKNKVMFKIINGDMFYFSELFTGIKYGIKAMSIIVACSISVIIWSVLFIVPGIIKAISYSMALYVLTKNPEKSVNECIAESKKIMENKKIQFIKVFLLMIIKLIAISTVLVIPYMICVTYSSDIIVLMFVTFAFVCVYPTTLFVLITYYELSIVVFYENACEQSCEEQETMESELCNIGMEVA